MPALGCVCVCVWVHGGVVGDSADRCVMTAYHCRGAGARVAGGGFFWRVFSPRLRLRASELGLTKEKRGGEAGGAGPLLLPESGRGRESRIQRRSERPPTCPLHFCLRAQINVCLIRGGFVCSVWNFEESRKSPLMSKATLSAGFKDVTSTFLAVNKSHGDNPGPA